MARGVNRLNRFQDPDQPVDLLIGRVDLSLLTFLLDGRLCLRESFVWVQVTLDERNYPTMLFLISLRGEVDYSDGNLLHILVDKSIPELTSTDTERNADVANCKPKYFAIQHAKQIAVVSYGTGMRLGEILGLTWNKADLKGGFIRLKGEDTKSGEGRLIPLDLSPGLREMFKELHRTRAMHEQHVFLHDGQPVRSLKGAFKAACKGAGVTNFRFHDLRHTAITNMRRAGIDPLTIMQISGHKTIVCFTRYNSFREADLRAAAFKSNTYLTLAHTKAAEQMMEETRTNAASA